MKHLCEPPSPRVAVGGGAVLDLGKALAALVPAPDGPMEHLEVVGKGLALKADPLPFIAIPTTAGTGAEVTKNAVIGLPDLGRKVSLRDDRMVARLAIVDPALTDHCPKAVTLASGLDAVTQVIEPFVSIKATPYTEQRDARGIRNAAAARLRQCGRDCGCGHQDQCEAASKHDAALLWQCTLCNCESGGVPWRDCGEAIHETAILAPRGQTRRPQRCVRLSNDSSGFSSRM